jgi:hypothetical protein
VPTGRGRSLGAAAVDLFERLFGGRVRTSYRAKGWHAQIRELTATAPGRAAADAAGLSPSATTLLAWLAERQVPNKANRELIDKAYRMMRGVFDDREVRKDIRLTGLVSFQSATGRRDSRFRGRGGNAPLLIDGAGGVWEPIAEAWDRGVRDPDTIGYLFIEYVIIPDFGEISEGSWYSAFDGDWYELEI